MLKIIEKTKLWFSISIVLILIGFIYMGVYGLQYNIDFKGGTLVQINMEKDFDKAEADKIVTKYAPDAETKKAVTEDKIELEVRSQSISDDKIASMVKDIKEKFELKSKNPLIAQENIGPSMGKEVRNKAMIALTVATIAMLIYVGIRFEFKFGIAAILALVHDVLITVAVYAVFKIPVGSGFIAAMLTIIGYSINDTIVVFDRIRENMKKTRKYDIVELADMSITETMARSINTVATTLFTIVAVYFCVPSVRDFAFPLIIGVISGCYSSIFIASPLWVIFKKASAKKNVASAR